MYGYETLSAVLRDKYTLEMAVKRVLRRKSEPKARKEMQTTAQHITQYVYTVHQTLLW
jgi:hypothetical protein